MFCALNAGRVDSVHCMTVRTQCVTVYCVHCMTVWKQCVTVDSVHCMTVHSLRDCFHCMDVWNQCVTRCIAVQCVLSEGMHCVAV